MFLGATLITGALALIGSAATLTVLGLVFTMHPLFLLLALLLAGFSMIFWSLTVSFFEEFRDA